MAGVQRAQEVNVVATIASPPHLAVEVVATGAGLVEAAKCQKMLVVMVDL